jgi:hypothetical protein
MNSHHSRLFATICGLLSLAGCGYIGEPLPPLMNIPARVGDLAAVERGSKLVVQFTVPTMTTEGKVLTQALRLELRIGPKPFNPETAKPASQGAVVQAGGARYEIPASQWVGKEVSIAVKVIGANGRDAGWSTAVDLPVVSPPEQPTDLHVEAVPQGVRLTWKGAGKDFGVFRRGPDEHDFSLLAHTDKPEYTDTTIEWGKAYLYLVQSFVKAGKVQAESDLSEEVQIVPRDTFPPPVPVGLTGVPSTSTIELVWERNTAANIAGYRVYRALGNGPFQLLVDTQEAPSYSDHKIESGKVYRYAVTAVKRNGMESEKTAPVEVTAP